MISFVTLKKYMRFLGVYPDSNRDRIWQLIPVCIYVVLLSSFFISALWFFCFDATVLNEFTGSFYFMCVSSLAFSWHSNYLWQSENYANLFDHIDTIINKRSENPVIKDVYQKTIQRIEVLTKKTHFYLMQTSVPLFTTLDMILSMIGYLFFDVSPDSFQLTYLGTFPVDWKTPRGYVMVGIFEATSILAAAEMYAITLVLNLGYCYILSDFVSDLETDLRQFDQDCSATSNRSIQNQNEIKRRLWDIFQFHAEARTLAISFSKIHKLVTFACLVYPLLAFGCLFLEINDFITASDYASGVKSGISFVVDMIWLFCCCHYGFQVTDRFDSINDTVYQLDWYTYPTKVQKDLQFIFAASQRSIYIEGFCNTRCTRDKFTKVINTTFSYFMVLRSFN